MKNKTKLVNAGSLEQTSKLGHQIGSNLKGGEVIELSGDLGSGKTTLIKAIVHGAGSFDHVSSPTFVVSKAYKAPDFNITHYDFYRLSEPGLMFNDLHEQIEDDDSVKLIEWGGSVSEILPINRVVINLSSQTEDSRIFEINYSDNLSYLMRDI